MAQTSPRVAMAVNVTAEDKTKFIQQDLEENIKLCDKSFQERKFDCAEAGLKIGHVIISEFLKERIASTPQNQRYARTMRTSSKC